MATATPFRNRVTGLRYVRADALIDHPHNFRTHPKHQRDALADLLAEVGIAGALLAYETPHGLQLIDGHLRKDAAPDTIWPVLVLDVDDAEAALLLATVDPISALAGTDAVALEALLGSVATESDAITRLLADLGMDAEMASAYAAAKDRSPAPAGVAAAVIKPVLVASDIPVLEAALTATGAPTRGEALMALCRHYLASHAQG